ncbi:MAG: DUF4399 domain-containing protein [Rhizobiales bacterium]|nr:DUF4399 domain-containing protein [Hyphomicrobiales bacterium]
MRAWQRILGLSLILTGAAALTATADDRTPAPEGASVYFIGLADGDTVTSPLVIRFGLKGMGVAPAGVEKEKTGHHHLIIDETVEGDELLESLPADDNHKHFGGGQTEATITLASGRHTLQLVVGDHNHIPHNPPIMSERITITVK